MRTDALIAGEALPRSTVEPQSLSLAERQQSAIVRAELCAEDLFLGPPEPADQAPISALRRLHAEGFYTAPLPAHLGGLGLGSESGGHRALLRVLASFGGADLALGRLYEGHVNALLLIVAFGSPEQQRQAALDAQQGKLFGVWNTGEATPMRLVDQGGCLELRGAKTFATGAAIVERPIVTVERSGWQMTLPRMETPLVANAVRIDRSSWQPLGMASSESFSLSFDGARIATEDLIGAPGDFYRDPLFRGGAIRFAAVQTGALNRLARLFADWLREKKRQDDPYQLTRLAEIELLSQQAVLWIQRASDIAEACMSPTADEASTRQMIRCGNLTRLAVERSATAVLTHVIAGVGAHGLLRPARFERIIRDLTMYLRQPSPDAALADVGRSSLSGAVSPLWSDLATSRTGF